jgi:hypothetical protein
MVYGEMGRFPMDIVIKLRHKELYLKIPRPECTSLDGDPPSCEV